MAARVTCKFDEDPIKIERHYRLDKVKYGLFLLLKGKKRQSG